MITRRQIFLNTRLINEFVPADVEGAASTARQRAALLQHEVGARVQRERPLRWSDDILSGGLLVLEECVATKVILPAVKAPVEAGLQRLAVWISDPPSLPQPTGKYDWPGTFLYLIEAHWQDDNDHFFSGCSALQAVANVAQGKVFNTPIPFGKLEPLGRHSSAHPVEKLAGIGGIASVPRKICSFYMARYMSDGEQTILHNGESRRTNDLLAYPFYIDTA